MPDYESEKGVRKKKKPFWLFGKRDYLSDFHMTASGAYVYGGSLWRYIGEESYKKFITKAWLLALFSLFLTIGGGLLPAAGMSHHFYVVLPYAGAVIFEVCIVWALVQMGRTGELKNYEYERSARVMPARTFTAIAFTIVAMVGELMFLALVGTGEKLLPTVLYLLAEAGALTLNLILHKHIKMQDWEELPNENGTI